MKLTKAELKKIIKEELDRFAEAEEDTTDAGAEGEGDTEGLDSRVRKLIDDTMFLKREKINALLGKLKGNDKVQSQLLAYVAAQLGWDFDKIKKNAAYLNKAFDALKEGE